MNQHTDVHALAAPYSLNALDPTEHTAFGSHLQHCAGCHQEVADFQATAARLAAAAAQAPPAAMKQRTVAAISGVRQLPPRAATTLPTKRFGVPRAPSTAGRPSNPWKDPHSPPPLPSC
ncbi:hypothetical protein [Streptomyces sp. Qhu_M48]|uniref:hypothetical protein n=1 Tax=Streptomyces sp. Qhu_M48 TaxID=3435889 RepID=UPI003F5039FE